MNIFRKSLIFLILSLLIGSGLFFYRHHSLPEYWDASGAPQHNLKVLKRAIYYVENNYVDTAHLDALELLKKGLQTLQQGLAPVMVQWDKNKLTLEVAGHSRRIEIPQPLTLKDLPNFFGHVSDFIDAHLPVDDDDNPDQNIEHLIVGGVISALDPHSTFLRPKIYSEFKIGTTGNFGGIGIAIGIRDDYLTVIAPLEGTPAFRAGLKANDRIIQVNDERTINMTLTEAVERLRGKIGTEVTLIVRRENASEPLSFTLRRALITIDSVKAKLIPDEKIALLKIKSFQEDTVTEFVRALRKLYQESKGFNGIILDLRNNPGGLLDQSVALADIFLSEGVIVSTVGLNNQLHEEDKAKPNDLLEKIPLVVIVNEGSASASEILAGALQAHGRAIVLGNQTFGKGTVQTLYDLKDGSALKLTIAKYLAAGTEDVQATGITPNVLMTPLKVSDERIDLVANKAHREDDLEQGFKKQAHKDKAESQFKLPYFKESKEEESISGTVKIEHDYPIILATRLLAAEPQAHLAAQLNTIEKLLVDLQAEQDAHIVTAFKNQKIDWSLPTITEATHTPKIESEYWLTIADKKVTQAIAGEEMFLHLQVKNNGTHALHRILGITTSKNPLLNDLELAFGKINPGEVQTAKVKISLPAIASNQQVPVEISFQDHKEKIFSKIDIPLEIHEPARPRFQYSWQLSDNSAIKHGTDIDLIFSIKNIGTGKAKQAVLNLANKEGSHIFLKKGRVDIKELAPGDSREAKATVRFNSESDLNTSRLTVSIEDAETGYALLDTLSFNSDLTALSPAQNKPQVAPTLTVQLPEQPYWSEAKTYTFTGTATDDDRIKEIYIFSNYNKVYYRAMNPSEGKSVSFNLEIDLEAGPNRITVLAKDAQNLVSRERWIVWKPE